MKNHTDGPIVTTQETVLAIAAGALMLFGGVGFLFGEYMLAGLCFLLGSMTIYLRGTRT